MPVGTNDQDLETLQVQVRQLNIKTPKSKVLFLGCPWTLDKKEEEKSPMMQIYVPSELTSKRLSGLVCSPSFVFKLQNALIGPTQRSTYYLF